MEAYVNPIGPNSDSFYHGLIMLPGQGGLVRIQDFINNNGGAFTIPVNVNTYTRDLALHLGYEDDGYRDNGYYAHDNGTQDQCKGVGPAEVWITIVSATPAP